MPSEPSPEIAGAWERTLWHGERAWTSANGPVRAIVSEERARLVHLGSADGSVNLVNAPQPRRLPTADDPWPNQGGHRFWLGPQHRWVWPPPAEWEYSSAAWVTVDRGVLILQHAHLNQSYPAIRREYAWEGGRIRCTVSWPDNGRSYFGLHVIAVDTPFALTARLEPRRDAPLGVVAARMVDPEPPLQLPQPALALCDGHATVCSGVQRKKFGFVPQTLRVERPGGWVLCMHPGPCSRANGQTPDQGFLSQVWVGDGTIDIAEMEQLTPHLAGDASGLCSTTIFIEAAPPVR
jgi:hypothetical protein